MTVLTGKSGSGKTTLLKAAGFPNTFFADDFVKRVLYQRGHEVNKIIINLYPSININGDIDTKALGKILFNDLQEMNKVGKIIAPFVIDWIRHLPADSIVEMAGYINYENIYKPYFHKVILITRETQDLKKFNHIENMQQPIKNTEIKYNKLIENNKHIADAVIKLKTIHNSLF